MLLKKLGAGTLLTVLLISAAGCAKNQSSSESDLDIIFIGLDGATWEIIDPLFEAGKMPNLKRIVSRGVRADLTSRWPFKSPQAWTSIATGKQWEKHGIFDFNVGDVPVSSSMRKTKAIWNIVSESGLSVGVNGYWVTWPAEKVNGYLISQRGYLAKKLEDTVYPEDLLDEYGDFWVWLPHSQENFSELKRFIDFEFDSEYWDPFRGRQGVGRVQQALADYREDPRKHVKFMNHFILDNRLLFHYPKDESTARLADWLLKRRPVDLFIVYFQGIDVTSHGFWKYHKPASYQTTPAEVRAFRNVVPAYYEYIDEKIGQVASHMGPNTVLIVGSDHGFEAWHPEPEHQHWYLSGNHKSNGMLAMAGGPIRRGVTLPDAHMLDMTPTMLYLLGLELGADMDGSPLLNALEPEFVVENPVRYRKTWDDASVEAASEPEATEADAEEMERLRALGYIE